MDYFKAISEFISSIKIALCKWISFYEHLLRLGPSTSCREIIKSVLLQSSKMWALAILWVLSHSESSQFRTYSVSHTMLVFVIRRLSYLIVIIALYEIHRFSFLRWGNWGNRETTKLIQGQIAHSIEELRLESSCDISLEVFFSLWQTWHGY